MAFISTPPLTPDTHRARISVALIGGGPGGLAAAIAISKLPFAVVTIYEQAPEPREVGAGLSIGQNAWNVLDLLGASDSLTGADTDGTTQRNAYSGAVVHRRTPILGKARRGTKPNIRARRTALQAALLEQLPSGIIEFNKKVSALEDLGKARGVRLLFKDGSKTDADLVIGADGIRSITRRVLFPDHKLHYTGNTAFRTLLPVARMRHLGFPPETSWWHARHGHFYFSHVDDPEQREMCELTLRSYHEDELEGDVATWAIPATNDRVLSRIGGYDTKVQDLFKLVPEGDWREFRMVSGPCLQEITGWDKIALIGDASHPLSGAFGSGAAFAMEDGWILAKALEHTITSEHPVKDALIIFEEIRNPYYQRMFKYLADKETISAMLKSQNSSFDDILAARIAALGSGGGHSMEWIYKNDIKQTWELWLEQAK